MTLANRLKAMTDKPVEECQDALNWSKDNLTDAFYYMRFYPIAKEKFDNDKERDIWIKYQVKNAVIGEKR